MNAGIEVVVCIGERVEPLRDCTRALAREAGDGFRVVRAHAAWQARQRVVDESTADVIAFVDPDVVVPEGWLDTLRFAWESAPHSVAAIGGPIRAEDAPEWAGGRLGLIDLGDDLLELDPAERTLMGGNLSFWRRCLVGVGGFDAPLDRRDATDWLSEEHEAQRQLGHWGWVVRYAPALAAERVVSSARPLSRSWRYGMRTGIAGSRDTRLAVTQGAKSGAGALAALARGRRDTAAERAARAAENLGVLAGRRRAKLPGRSAAITPGRFGEAPALAPEMGPASDGGPVRATGAPIANRPANAPRSSVDLVLLYHRFADPESDPLGLCVSPANFEEQLRVLRDGYEVAPMRDIASSVRDGAGGAGRLAITIDDGYIDNLTTGIPAIAEAGLPATLFAATGHIETGRRFFWDEMEHLITGPGSRPKQLSIDGRTWKTANAAQRETARAELHALVQPRGLDEIERVLGELRKWAGEPQAPASGRGASGGPGAQAPASSRGTSSGPGAARAARDSTRPVTVDELKQLAATPGLEIGAHTRDHVNLGHRPEDELRAQVERSRDDVAAWTGAAPTGFSYPFGIPRHDVSAAARATVAAAGFGYAVVNQPVGVEEGDDVYAIPRLFAPNVGAREFDVFLRRALR